MAAMKEINAMFDKADGIACMTSDIEKMIYGRHAISKATQKKMFEAIDALNGEASKLLQKAMKEEDKYYDKKRRFRRRK